MADPNFAKPAIFKDTATPVTPESGYSLLYSASGMLTTMNSAGVANTLSGGGSPAESAKTILNGAW